MQERMSDTQESIPLQLPIVSGLFGLALTVGIAYLVATHFGELEDFTELLQRAEPIWLLAAVALQIGTYMCAGGIWNVTISSGGKRLSLGVLARLSIEKLTINQLLPTAGIMGNLFVVRVMKRYGIPSTLAIESLFIDSLSHYGAFAAVTAITLSILALSNKVTPVIAWLIGIISIVLVIIPVFIAWLLHHRTWRPPAFINRLQSVHDAFEALAKVSPKHVTAPRLLTKTFLLQVAIYSCDSATLWAMLQAVDIHVSPLIPFCAMIIGVMAGTVSFIPGGIGSFEAGCITTLTLLGVPVEAALTATLLLRLLTLWLPLIPGMALARQDLKKHP